MSRSRGGRGLTFLYCYCTMSFAMLSLGLEVSLIVCILVYFEQQKQRRPTSHFCPQLQEAGVCRVFFFWSYISYSMCSLSTCKHAVHAGMQVVREGQIGPGQPWLKSHPLQL